MPLKLTIRHRHAFGTDRDLVGRRLAGPNAWDRLRLDGSGAFSVPKQADAWQHAAQRSDLRKRAVDLDALLSAGGAESVGSYGVGTALLELNLHFLRPERRLVLTEFAPNTLKRLQTLTADLTQPRPHVQHHDLTVDDPLTVDVHLFHRIDTEFDNETWREVFCRFAAERIVVVAAEVLGPRQFAATLRNRLSLRRSSVAGWIRTTAAFEDLWRDTHAGFRCVLGDLPSWTLRPREASS